MESKFDQRCKDFDRRRPAEPPVKRTFWFEARWEDGRQSVNDLLRRFLMDNGLEYLNTFNGDAWFILDGNWCRCDYEIDGGTVRFYLCEFTEDRGKRIMERLAIRNRDDSVLRPARMAGEAVTDKLYDVTFTVTGGVIVSADSKESALRKFGMPEIQAEVAAKLAGLGAEATDIQEYDEGQSLQMRQNAPIHAGIGSVPYQRT